MPTAKLASGLPSGDANGLLAIVEHLIGAPHDLHVVVALVDCKRTTTDNDTGEVVPTARVRRIEVISDPTDGQRLISLLRRAYETRTGKAVLPLALEDELRAVFGQGVDPDTGEIRP
ncbi:MAG: hypothetical protein HYR62_02010 [Actinobacteria bacterium]|nr:hypothetical protein [Actinomycetota bacterium]MBI3687258.1 hypothetical protein [Actinomycetota bacterium]